MFIFFFDVLIIGGSLISVTPLLTGSLNLGSKLLLTCISVYSIAIDRIIKKYKTCKHNTLSR